jgi:hypothetical protein
MSPSSKTCLASSITDGNVEKDPLSEKRVLGHQRMLPGVVIM